MYRYKIIIVFRDGHVETLVHYWDDDHITKHFKEEFEKNENILMIEIYKEFKEFNRA